MKHVNKSCKVDCWLVYLVLIFSACAGTEVESDPVINPSREIATDIDMLFSDSSNVMFRILSPRLKIYCRGYVSGRISGRIEN